MTNKRFCSECLLYEGIRLWLHPRTIPAFARQVRVDSRGVCSVCAAYRRWTSAPLRQNERRGVIETKAKRCVVLFSGGKDSSATLAFVRRELGFEAVAMLLDNGLIPAATIDRGRRLCEQLGAELQVVRRADLGLLERATEDGETPCALCAVNAMDAALVLAVERDAPWIFQGTNYFAAWDMVPVGERPFAHGGREFRLVHLPYVFGFTRERTAHLLREIDYRAEVESGVSTNCLLPGIVQERLSESLGHVPEFEDLALEVMVGHLRRDDAVAELRHKAPKQQHLLEGIAG